MNESNSKAPTSGFQLYSILINHRNIIAFFSVLLALILSAGLPRLGFDSSINVLIAEDNPYLVDYDKHGEKFPRYENINFIVTLNKGDFYSAKNIESLRQLVDGVMDLPFVAQVNSLLNYLENWVKLRVSGLLGLLSENLLGKSFSSQIGMLKLEMTF